MVYNEALKREIPAGWEVGSLSNWIANDKSGDWGKESAQGNYVQQVTCFRGADINGLNGKANLHPPTRYILKKNSHKLLEDHDLIVEISGGSPTQSTGRMAHVTQETLERFDNSIICSNFCRAISLDSRHSFYTFIYLWRRLYEAGVFFGWEGKTSGIKNLLFDACTTAYRVEMPPERVHKLFYDIMKPIDRKRQKALLENERLAALRDWLLPMLMNGQVRVEPDKN